MELFEDGEPTGQMVFIQIKGTEGNIEKLKGDEVSCLGVSKSNIQYANQNNVPVILIYVTLAEPRRFYYIDLNPIGEQLIDEFIKDSNRKTVRIPSDNVITDNFEPMFNLIKSYFIK